MNYQRFRMLKIECRYPTVHVPPRQAARTGQNRRRDVQHVRAEDESSFFNVRATGYKDAELRCSAAGPAGSFGKLRGRR